MPVLFNTLEKCFIIETYVRLKNIRLCIIFFTTDHFHKIEYHNMRVLDIFNILNRPRNVCLIVIEIYDDRYLGEYASIR